MVDEIVRGLLSVLMLCGMVFFITFVVVFVPSIILVRIGKSRGPSFGLTILIVAMALSALGGLLAIGLLFGTR